MICRLCIQHTYNFLNIFDRNGLQLGISEILGRHFWFKPHPDDQTSSTAICTICWSKVNDFHQFYLTVEQAHATLSANGVKEETFTELLDNEFIDPELIIKEEFAEIPCMLVEGTVDIGNERSNPFCELDSEKILNKEEIKTHYAAVTDVDAAGSSLGLVVEEGSNKLMTNETHGSSDEFGSENSKNEVSAGTSSSMGIVRKKRKIATKVTKSKKLAQNKRKVIKVEQGENIDHKILFKDRNIVGTKKEDDEMVNKYIQMTCELCTYVGEDYISIRKHFCKEHPKVKSYVRCCNKKLFHRLEIVKHAYKHHDPEFFKCNICQKVFSEQGTLSRHMIGSHAPEEELNFHCDKCPKRFSRQKKLELHRSSHVPMNERTFICDQCPNSRFANNDLLKIHICMRHRQATNICHVCAKEIRDKASFEKHVRSHFEDSGPKVKCTIEGCDSWLKDYDNLRKHIRRSHTTEDKPETCETCGREYKNRSALSKHKRRVHSNIVYTCEECKKTFKRAIYLREHMTQHTGEILYKCLFCTRTFNSNANMHSHKKKMHPVEWDNWRKTNNGSSQQLIEKQKNKQNMNAAKTENIALWPPLDMNVGGRDSDFV